MMMMMKMLKLNYPAISKIVIVVTVGILRPTLSKLAAIILGYLLQAFHSFYLVELLGQSKNFS